MSKNPTLNAFMAALYIVGIVSVMSFASRFTPKEDTFLAPIAVTSLFTLSAAVMAYLFCLEPLQLVLSGKREQAVKLFLQTIGVFAVFTIILIFFAFRGF